MILIEVYYQVWSRHLRLQNPRVFRGREALPSYKELQVAASSVEARFEDLLNFPFGLSINNIRWQSFVIWSVGFCLAVLCQKVYMENGVNLHRWREC